MFCERLRELRHQRGLSRAALGSLVGVSSTAVYKWENGICQPDYETLQKLADVFAITLDSLTDRPLPKQESDPGYSEVLVNRAVRRMTPAEQAKFIEIGRVLFAHAFEDEQTGV